MRPDPLLLSYLAGIIDADGYISIRRSKGAKAVYFGPTIGIAGTRREPHDLAASFWGGMVRLYSPRDSTHRSQFQWSLCGRAAAGAIADVEPYLRVKSEQAFLALQLWEHLEFGRLDDPYPWFGPDYDPRSHSEDFRCEIAAVQVRKGRRSKAAPN